MQKKTWTCCTAAHQRLCCRQIRRLILLGLIFLCQYATGQAMASSLFSTTGNIDILDDDRVVINDATYFFADAVSFYDEAGLAGDSSLLSVGATVTFTADSTGTIYSMSLGSSEQDVAASAQNTDNTNASKAPPQRTITESTERETSGDKDFSDQVYSDNTTLKLENGVWTN